MKRFSQQLQKQSKTVKLRASEKNELRERLVSYMEYHPLPAEIKAVPSKKKTLRPAALAGEAFTTVSLPFSLVFKSSAVAAALVLVVVPLIAEKSVPGDTLYAVKVQFNEEVRSTLTFDSVQKVEWETARLNRRIAEARLLASEGRLTEEVEAEVAQAVRTHTENAQKEIAVLRTQDAEEATIASIAFDSTLEAQATSLKEDEDDSTEVRIKAAPKPSNLIADAVDASRALGEQPNASSTPSYEKLMARVELNTTRMYELRDSLTFDDPAAATEVTRRIEDIERSVKEAIDLVEKEDAAARVVLVDVLKRTQKLIVFMTDLQVSDSVDIEELVPVVLTDEEEGIQTTKYIADITQANEEIEKILATSDVLENIREKITVGREQVDQILLELANETDFAAVSSKATKALEITKDSLQILEEQRGSILNEDGIDEPEETASTTATTTPLTEVENEETPEESESATSTETELTNESESAVSTTTVEIE